MTNLFLSLFGISISISFMVIVLILLSPLLNRRYASRWKYLIWIFLALRLLVPFHGLNGQHVTDMMSKAGTQNPSKPEKNIGAPTGETTPSGRIIVEIPEQMTAPIVMQSTLQSGKGSTGITMLDMVAYVWMTGSILFLSVHFISYCCYKRGVMKRGKNIADAHILRQVCEIKRELQIVRTVKVMESPEAGSPMIIGFLNPIVVLPNERYSSEELFFILKHELVHLKRGDLYWKLLFVTANAVHWFNPFIWIMQKEAAIDMELSCDERVTQGAGETVRKAYTETLLSMLHKQCAKRTALSTQFYGGKKIMKKRFRNILAKNRKKNGVFIFLCAMAFTVILGTLVGCSVAKEDNAKQNAAKTVDERKDSEKQNDENMPDQPEKEADEPEQILLNDTSTDDSVSDGTTMLTFSKEGEQEQKQAVLTVGDGYSIFLPIDEWKASGPDLWNAAVNEHVGLWVTHFEGESFDSVAKNLADMGYETHQNERWKQDGDLIYHVALKDFENDIWGIFYCYPAESAEGWGRELPVIADTFALSSAAEDAKANGSQNESLSAEDCENIKTAVNMFAEAYFEGNADAVQKLLADTFEGEIDTYEGTGIISDLTVKGLSDTDDKVMEDGQYATVSLAFRDSNYDDMFLYISFRFIKQEGVWKIQSYGVEG